MADGTDRWAPGCGCCSGPPPPEQFLYAAVTRCNQNCTPYGYCDAPYGGCAVAISGPSGFSYACTTPPSGYCGTAVPGPGTYAVTVTTPGGASKTRSVVVPPGRRATTAAFRFTDRAYVTVFASRLCPDDPPGTASVTFGSYGSASVTPGSPAVVPLNADLPPGTVVTATCVYKGRTQTKTFTVGAGGACPSFAFGTFYCGISVGVCGCSAYDEPGPLQFPLAGAAVAVTGAASGSCTTNANGYCPCLSLNPCALEGDALTLTASKDGYCTAAVPLTVAAGGLAVSPYALADPRPSGSYAATSCGFLSVDAPPTAPVLVNLDVKTFLYALESCQTCFLVVGCNGLPLPGATVVTSSGHAGTTGPDGTVCGDFGVPGYAYTGTVTADRFRRSEFSYTAGGCWRETVGMAPAYDPYGYTPYYTCCPECVVPLRTVLTYLDRNGTHPAPLVSTGPGGRVWGGCYEVSKAGCNGLAGPLAVRYKITCAGGGGAGHPTFRLQVDWYGAACQHNRWVGAALVCEELPTPGYLPWPCDRTITGSPIVVSSLADRSAFLYGSPCYHTPLAVSGTWPDCVTLPNPNYMTFFPGCGLDTRPTLCWDHPAAGPWGLFE